MIKDVFIEDNHLIYQLESNFPTYFLKTKLSDDLKNNVFSKYFIYLENSNIIGFVNYYELYDRFELAYIEVDIKYRNKNVGSKMMDYLIDVGKKRILLILHWKLMLIIKVL